MLAGAYQITRFCIRAAFPSLAALNPGIKKVLVLTEKEPIFPVNTPVNIQSQSIDHQVRSRIYGHGRGWVFTPKHFQGIGSTAAVDSALRWQFRPCAYARGASRGLDYSTMSGLP